MHQPKSSYATEVDKVYWLGIKKVQSFPIDSFSHQPGETSRLLRLLAGQKICTITFIFLFLMSQ